MLKFVLISFFLFYAKSQFLIPDTFEVSYTIHDDKGPVAYIHEHGLKGYISLVMRNSNAEKPTVYLPYDVTNVLKHEKGTDKCGVVKQTYDSISFLAAINDCIKKKTKKLDNVLTCAKGEITFTEKKINDHYLPVKFTGLGLKDKEYGTFEKVQYTFTQSIVEHLDPIPHNIACEGLTMMEKLNVYGNYYIIKDNTEYIHVKNDDAGMNFLVDKNGKKDVYLIDEAQIWSVGDTCNKTNIDMLSEERKYSKQELKDLLWKENVFSAPDFYKIYTYPDTIDGYAIVEKVLFVTNKVKATILGDKYEDVNIFAEVDFVGTKNPVFYIHSDKKTTVYDMSESVQEENFYAHLFEEKKKCNNIRSKRLIFTSEQLPKRSQYQFDNVASIIRTLADSLSMTGSNLVMSPLRLSELVYQVKDQILNIEVKVSESELPDTLYHKLTAKETHVTKTFKYTTDSISDCFKKCIIETGCEGVTFQDNLCDGLKDITFKGNNPKANPIYIYMPYTKEVPITDAKQFFKARKSPLISIDKNEVALVDVMDSITGMNIVDEENFNTFFKLDEKLPCESYINLHMPMTYQECAQKSKSYSQNIDISGFVYTIATYACRLCRSDSPSLKLGAQGEYKFRFNFIDGYKQVYEKKIKQSLIKDKLYSIEASSSEECAEYCEMHSEFSCISYFLCGDKCFLTHNYSIEKYNEESTEATDMCTANRRADTTLFTRSPIKLAGKSFKNLIKVDTDKAIPLVMESAKNTGYITCQDYLNIAYAITTDTMKDIYEWNEKYDYVCDFYKKIAMKSTIQVENEIIEIVEVGHTKGAIAGIVVAVFLVALIAAAGITFFVKRRS